MIRQLFTWLPFVFGLVALGAYVLPCRYRVRAQAIWAMVILTASSKFLCFRYFGGDAFAPEMPAFTIWLWDWLYSGMVILIPLALLRGLVGRIFRKVPPRRARAVLLPVLAWGLSAWGVWNGVKAPDVREISLSFPDLPAALDGYRLAQLSDLHISSAARADRTRAIVERTNAAKPDLVVITGDFVDGEVQNRRRDVVPLRGLKAPDGVWAVTGNHEYYWPWWQWSRVFEEDCGIRFLHGTCENVRAGLALGGLDDRNVTRLGLENPETHPERIFEKAEAGAFRILLCHQPDHLDRFVGRTGARLVLSGHTHGGISPGLSWLVKRWNGGYVRGLYALAGDATLYLSPGSGQWGGFPIRFFNPSEITLITLRSAERKSP